MTRNQKIALGCGGAGCLGLIVVAVAGGLIYYFAQSYSSDRNYNSDITTNRNSNSNDSITNSNDNSSSSSSRTASSLSHDEKHKLYQAALMTADQEVIRRVSVKMGLMDEDYTPGAEWEQFITDHVGWVIRNGRFIQSINTEEKAREYINNNIPD